MAGHHRLQVENLEASPLEHLAPTAVACQVEPFPVEVSPARAYPLEAVLVETSLAAACLVVAHLVETCPVEASLVAAHLEEACQAEALPAPPSQVTAKAQAEARP